MSTPPKPSSFVRQVTVPRRRHFVAGLEVADRGHLRHVDEVTVYEFTEPLEPAPSAARDVGEGQAWLSPRQVAARTGLSVSTEGRA